VNAKTGAGTSAETSAEATALRVLSWAAEPSGAPPVGPLWDVTTLARPAAAIRDAAAELARRTAALLGAGVPPFGSESRIGLGAVFLAAAAGGRRQPGPAITLAQAIPPAMPRRAPAAWYDLVARHGLVSAILAALPAAGSEPAPTEPTEPTDAEPSLPEALLEASPLTAVLYRPTLRALRSDTTGQAVRTAAALLDRPRGPLVLADGLAGWTPFPAVLTWRAGLLSRLRPEHPDLLLDVYLVARTRFAADWDQRVRWAGRQLRSRGAPDPLAIATLRFWAPLAALQKDSVRLSQLRPLMTGHDQALDLVWRFHLDQAGAA
jgi:hypothetical protein